MSSVLISGPDARLRSMQCRCRSFRAKLALKRLLRVKARPTWGYRGSIEAVHQYARAGLERNHFVPQRHGGPERAALPLGPHRAPTATWPASRADRNRRPLAAIANRP